MENYKRFIGMHNKEARKTLSDFMRWLMRNGHKYPRVGCPSTTDDIVSSIRMAVGMMDASLEYNTLKALTSLAMIGATSMKCNPPSVPCIKEAHRIIRRMKKCQDTESQQSTLRG